MIFCTRMMRNRRIFADKISKYQSDLFIRLDGMATAKSVNIYPICVIRVLLLKI